MKPTNRVTFRGHTFDALTAQALEEAERRLGYELTITQGSFSHSVGASAGTHDGGGAVDLAPYDWQRKVEVLRQIGFAAWHRTPIPGVWPEHVHAVLVGDPLLAPAAQAQVQDYIEGRNGLANNGPDDGPRKYVGHRYQWVDPGSRGPNVDAAIKALRNAKGGKVRMGKIKAALKALLGIRTQGEK